MEARRAGLSCAVLERGTVADHLRRFPAGMVFFTPAPTLELDGLPVDSRAFHPTRDEAYSYYRRVAELAKLDLRTGVTVEGLRGSDGDFEVLARDRAGQPCPVRARKVVLATGVFGAPRAMEGVPGLELPKVRLGYRDIMELAGGDVLVVGVGNGAAEAAFRLAHAGARVTVLDRNESIPQAKWRWFLRDLQALVSSGRVRLLHRARLRAVHPDAVEVETPQGTERLPNDDVLLLLGYQPDVALLSSAGVHLHEDLVPEVDARTLQSNVPGVYVAGISLAGRSPDRVFIWSGRYHGKAIAAHLKGEPPPVQDLGLRTLEHWRQFQKLSVAADPALAREMVPAVTGELRDDLVDVYLSRPGRPEDAPPTAPIGPVMEALEGWLVRTDPDGSADFKGQRLPAAAMELLKRCDGTRRIREVAAELVDLLDQPADQLEALAVRVLFPLMRTGRLLWRPEPFPLPA